MTIVYRTAGAWGPGKGSNLTPAEVDGNFAQLDERLTDLEGAVPQPVSIDTIEVTGGAFTVTLTDATVLGPFALPTAAWRWTDVWSASTAYYANDLFKKDGGIYLVLLDHTSGATFDPLAFDVDDGNYYQLLIQAANNFDLSYFFPGTPGVGVGPTAAMIASMFARDAYMLAADVATKIKAKLEFATTAELILHIQKNGTEVGTVTFAAAATTGTIDWPDDVQFMAGDRMRIFIEGTDYDATAYDLYLSFSFKLGVL